MGTKLADIEFNKKNFSPGPGRYNSAKKQSIPSMKFGTGMRTSFDGGKEGKHRPGPNQYSADPSKIQRSAPNYGFGSELRQSESHKRLHVPGPGQYMAKTFTGQEGSRFSMAQTIDYEP